MRISTKTKIKRRAFPFIIIGIVVGIICLIGVFIKIGPGSDVKETLVSQSESVATNNTAGNEIKMDKNFSISIPNGWTEVKQEKAENVIDAKAYIHSGSNSGLYIDKVEYDPKVNTTLNEQGAVSFVPAGSTYKSFETNGRNNTCIYYSTSSNAGEYFCVTQYLWNRDYIYVVTININSYYYDRLSENMDYITGSCVINTDVPEDIFIGYNENLKCEFGLPFKWDTDGQNYSSTDGSLNTYSLHKNIELTSYTSLNLSEDFNMPDIVFSNVRYDTALKCVIAEGVTSDGLNVRFYIQKSGENLLGFLWKFKSDSVAELARQCMGLYRNF